MPFDILSAYLIGKTKSAPTYRGNYCDVQLSWQIQNITVVTDLSINILSVG